MADLRVPRTSQPPKCSQCSQPALGVYAWTEMCFGRPTSHKAILCATCGLGLADKIRTFEVKGQAELGFYKPNKDVRIVVRFNYEQTTSVRDKIALPRNTPSHGPVHKLMHTHEGKLIHSHRRIPRVWCEKCEKVVNPDVIVTVVTAKSGKEYRRTTSTCSVCGHKVHNPQED